MLQDNESAKVYVSRNEKRSRFLVDLAVKQSENLHEETYNEDVLNDQDFFKLTKPKKSFFVDFEGRYLKKWFFYPVITISVKIGYFFIHFLRFLFGILQLFLKLFSFKSKTKVNENNFLKESRSFALIPRPRRKNIFQKISFRRKKTEKMVSEEVEGRRKRQIFLFLLPQFRLNSFRTSLVFALLLTTLALPLKSFSFYYDLKDTRGRVLGVSEEAIDSIFLAGEQAKNMDFSQAEKSFQSAQNSFLEAKKEIGNLEILFNILGSVIPGKQAELAGSVDEILAAGNLSARIGEEISKTLRIFNEEDVSVKMVVEEFGEKFLVIESLLRELNFKLEQINITSLPGEYQGKFQDLKQKSNIILPGIVEINDMLKKAKIFLGFDYDKRYLLVFQNNTELRASGGFIGSYAIIDFSEGAIKNLEVPSGGSYDTEGGMFEKFLAPEPLHLVNPYWHFWDANWWSDWPSSAKKLEYFLEKSSGPSVDGVISFTPTVLEKFLDIFGTIDLGDKYNLQIDSDNFFDIVQTFSEEKPKNHPDYRENPYIKNIDIAINTDKSLLADNSISSSIDNEDLNVKPKEIIGDLLRAIIEQFSNKLNKELFLSLIKTAESSFSEKQALLYFNDDDLQEKIKEYKWDGRVEETDYDYLEIVHTNIAGAKSDKKINDQVILDSIVLPDGSIENTLKIKRVHTGIKSERFVGQRNVDWLRVYVPFGAELISANGFVSPDEKYFSEASFDAIIDNDIARGEGAAMTSIKNGTKVYHELGKTVFANWLMVDAGKSITIELKYRLPFKFEAKKELQTFSSKAINFLNRNANALVPFSFLWQKQPGIVEMTMKYNLSTDIKFQAVYQSEANLDCSKRCDMRTDMFWGYIFEKIE